MRYLLLSMGEVSAVIHGCICCYPWVRYLLLSMGEVSAVILLSMGEVSAVICCCPWVRLVSAVIHG